MSYGAPPPPGDSPYGAPAPANSSKAVWSLICGIVGLVLCGIVLGVVAVVLGRQAQREGRPGGMAKAGEILGYVDVVLSVLFIAYYVSR